MPVWMGIAVAIATPLLALAGAALGHLLSRRSAREADVWHRREETMRMLRWAAEQAVHEEPARRAYTGGDGGGEDDCDDDQA